MSPLVGIGAIEVVTRMCTADGGQEPNDYRLTPRDPAPPDCRMTRTNPGHPYELCRSRKPIQANHHSGSFLAFLLVLVVPLMVDLPPAACTAFTAADIAIWSAFAVDYGARLYLAPARWRFVRSHPLDLLVLVVPFLKPLRAVRLLRLARLGVVTGAAQSRAQRSLHATAAVYVTTLAAVLMVLAAAAMYDVERRPEPSA